MSDKVRIDFEDGGYAYVSKRDLEDAQRFDAKVNLDAEWHREVEIEKAAYAGLEDAPDSTKFEVFKANTYGAGDRPYEALHGLMEDLGRERRLTGESAYQGLSDAQCYGLVLEEVEKSDVGRQALDWAATHGSFRNPATGEEAKIDQVLARHAGVRKSASFLPTDAEECFVAAYMSLRSALG